MKVITHFLPLIAVITFNLAIGGCQSPSEQANSEHRLPKVVSTSNIIGDLAKRVGGDEIEYKEILKPGADPHVYEPVPADSVAFEQADLILYNGYNLEPGLIKIMNASGIKAEKFAVGEVIKPLDFQYKGQTVPDPHVWGDAKNAIAMVNAIRDQLIKLSPEDKTEFTNNAAQFTQELGKLDLWIRAQIETIPPAQRQLVTTHDAFQYYAQAYNLKIIGTLIGISTEEQPSAKTVKELADSIKNSQVPTIFAETTINPTLIKAVAAEAGVKLAPTALYSDSIGAAGSEADSYEKMLMVNTRTIVEALGGK